MEQIDVVHHYSSHIVGSLELRVSDKGVRSISFIPRATTSARSRNHTVLGKLVEELNLYFAKKLKMFSVPLDLTSGSVFQRRVWQELLRIPYGEIRSYAEVAEALGNSNAARAVGLANRSNPLPILIPCHRVIRTDGNIGGYASGVQIKKTLLELEGVTL